MNDQEPELQLIETEKKEDRWEEIYTRLNIKLDEVLKKIRERKSKK